MINKREEYSNNLIQFVLEDPKIRARILLSCLTHTLVPEGVKNNYFEQLNLILKLFNCEKLLNNEEQKQNEGNITLNSVVNKINELENNINTIVKLQDEIQKQKSISLLYLNLQNKLFIGASNKSLIITSLSYHLAAIKYIRDHLDDLSFSEDERKFVEACIPHLERLIQTSIDIYTREHVVVAKHILITLVVVGIMLGYGFFAFAAIIVFCAIVTGFLALITNLFFWDGVSQCLKKEINEALNQYKENLEKVDGYQSKKISPDLVDIFKVESPYPNSVILIRKFLLPKSPRISFWFNSQKQELPDVAVSPKPHLCLNPITASQGI